MLSPEQLDDLVAPIALYPDPLLSQVLVASTYPLELIEAQQWVRSNPSLNGQQAVDAAKQQSWDPSVQAMVALPQVLDRLTQNVRWTTDLGNAFLAQQPDVMAAVQRMRARAQADGHLSSTPQETVTTQVQNGQSAIEIMPSSPEVVYVPVYDPAYVWGPPLWGYYPSLWYPSYGFGFWPGVNIGLCFGGWGGWGGWGAWGWSPGWFNRGVFVNAGFFNHYGFRGGYYGGYGRGVNGRFAWTHNPSHRLGVTYPNRQLAGRFGAASAASRANIGRANFGSYGARNSFGQSNAGVRGRDSFGQSYGASRGRDSFGQSYGNRGSYGAQGGAQGFRGSQPGQGYQGYRGSQPGFSRGGGYQGSPYSSRGFSAPSSRGPSASSNSFRGGHSAPSSRSFNSAPAFRGGNGGFRGSAPSSQGGGHSFGGGGGHSGGGGGGHSFSGGGGHSGGGGGHSGGGGHGHR